MNETNMRALRKVLEECPEDGFYYGSFFSGEYGMPQWNRGETPPCGTVGCVAGLCCIAFNLTPNVIYLSGSTKLREDPSVTADRFLELSDDQSQFLFFQNVTFAAKEDALRRIDHLLAGGNADNYPWDEETRVPWALGPT